MPLVDPMTGQRLRPSMLRDSSDSSYANDGEAIDWHAQHGDIVFLIDRGSGANRIMFSFDADQLAGMLSKALRTQGPLCDEERDLLGACEALLARNAAMGDL